MPTQSLTERPILMAGVACAGLLLLSAAPAPLAARQQPSQFRGGIDIVAIDFLAVDRAGRPVSDLAPAEIALKVDGRPRDIHRVQFVKLAPTSREVPRPALPLPFGANDDAALGRTVLIVIDHEQIRPGEGKGAVDAAGRFLDRLAPADRVGLVTLPNGRVEVDLTTNHARVRAALSTVVGKAPRRSGISNISLDEALTVLKERIDPDKKFTEELIDRECRFAPSDSFCRTRVVQEALDLTRAVELATRASLAALRELLKGLADIEGPKAILFLSGTLVPFEDTHFDLEDVARAAARARAQMFVLQPHEAMLDATGRDQPPSLTRDGDHRLAGLQDLAGVTGGELYRLSGSGDAVYARIADLIAAHYLLGFESTPAERNGAPHTIEISTTRPGVTIRARPMFIIDEPDRSPPPLVLETLLRDRAVHRDLPLRASAYVFRDVDPNHRKIVVVVEPGDDATTLTSAAFALIDVVGQRAAQWAEAQGDTVRRRPLVTSAAVPPGDYRLRVVATDTEGRRGAVDYEFAAELTSAPPLTLGTLMLGSNDDGTFRPRLLFAATDNSVTGHLEFYGRLPPGSDVRVTLEIATAPDGPPIAAALAQVMSADGDRFVASGAAPFDRMPAGDYVVRATVWVDGQPAGRALRTLRRKGPSRLTTPYQ